MRWEVIERKVLNKRMTLSDLCLKNTTMATILKQTVEVRMTSIEANINLEMMASPGEKEGWLKPGRSS